MVLITLGSATVFMTPPEEKAQRSERCDDDPVQRAVFERRVPVIALAQRDPFRHQVVEVHPALQVHCAYIGMSRFALVEPKFTPTTRFWPPIALKMFGLMSTSGVDTPTR